MNGASFTPRRGGKLSTLARKAYEFVQLGDTVTIAPGPKATRYAVAAKRVDAEGVPLVSLKTEHSTTGITEVEAHRIRAVWVAS